MSDAKRRELASAQFDPFDPFQVWLGFPQGESPQDYYALFRLPRFAEDFDGIRAAADKLTAEVRQIRPGNRLAEWTRLLDLLTTAGQTLRDPGKKAEYDRALRAGRVWPLAEEFLRSEPVQATPPAMQSAAPPAVPIIPAPPIVQREEPESSVATVSRPILLSPASSQPEPQVEAPPHWRRLAQQRSWLPRLVAMILLLAAVVSSIQIMRNREAWSAWFAKQWPRRSNTVARLDMPPAVAGNNEQAKNRQTNRPASGVNGHEPTGGPPRDTVSPPNPEAGNGLAHHSAPADSRVKPPSPDSHSEDTSPVGLPQSTGAEPPTATDTPAPAVPLPASRPEQPVAVPNQAVPSQNSQNQDPVNESESSLGDTATGLPPQMVPLVAGIWDALGRRDLEAARAQLNSLASRVRTPAERDLAEALDFLLRHVEEFWRSFRKIMYTLKSGEEFAVGDTYIAVVEVSQGGLVVRAEGRNFRFTLQDMPTSLVRLIVTRRFRPGPEADALYGAFLAVDPKGDPQQAQQLWRSAASQGLDTELLLKALRYRPSR